MMTWYIFLKIECVGLIKNKRKFMVGWCFANSDLEPLGLHSFSQRKLVQKALYIFKLQIIQETHSFFSTT